MTRTLDDVRSALESPETHRRIEAVDALAHGDIASAPRSVLLELVERALGDKAALVRTDACYAAADRQLDELGPVLRKRLASDPDATVRASAAEALGELEASDSIDALFEALADEDDGVRVFAANSLGLVAPAGAVQRLHTALESETETSVRVNLLIAALRLGAGHLLDALLGEVAAATHDEDDTLRMLNALDDLASRPRAIDERLVAERLGEALVAIRPKVSAIDRGLLDSLVDRLRERATR